MVWKWYDFQLFWYEVNTSSSAYWISKKKKELELSITSRQETHIISFNNLKFTSFLFTNDKYDKAIKRKLEEADYILISIPPIDGEDIVAKFIDNNLKSIKCKWTTYLSATSVYGNHKGEWVDELSKTQPTSPLGINRLKVEKKWLSFAKKTNLPLQIFRLSGIYSNKNNPSV